MMKNHLSMKGLLALLIAAAASLPTGAGATDADGTCIINFYSAIKAHPAAAPQNPNLADRCPAGVGVPHVLLPGANSVFISITVPNRPTAANWNGPRVGSQLPMNFVGTGGVNGRWLSEAIALDPTRTGELVVRVFSSPFTYQATAR